MHVCFIVKNKKVKKKRLKVAELVKDPIDCLDPNDPGLDQNFIDSVNLDQIWIPIKKWIGISMLVDPIQARSIAIPSLIRFFEPLSIIAEFIEILVVCLKDR